MRSLHLGSAVAVLSFVLGCGHNSPVAPGPAAPTAAGLAIAGADAVLSGVPAEYSATLTLSNGTSRAATPTWSSSDPAVATVDGSGRLQGRAHGSVTLTASSDGQTASRIVRVVNNYNGTWQGRFLVDGCDAPPGFCASMDVDIFAFPIYLAVSQSGADQSDVRATLILSNFNRRSELTGRVTPDGRLNLSGSAEVRSRDGSLLGTFHVGAWDTILREGDTMAGRWAQRYTNVQPPFNELMVNQLESMTRLSTAGGPVSAR
jgi:hypothetical protein